MVRESRIDLVSGELPKQLEALLNYGMNYACRDATPVAYGGRPSSCAQAQISRLYKDYGYPKNKIHT